MEKVKQEILESSSLPGLQKFIRNENKLIKLIWLLCLAILFAASLWFITVSIISFDKNEVITNIKIVKDEPTQFPMVTFCIDSGQNTTTDLKKFLKSCKFGQANCSYADFQQNNYKHSVPISRLSDICFTFNSGQNSTNHTVQIKNVNSTNTKLKLELEIQDFKSDQFGNRIPYKMLLFISNSSNVFNAYEMYDIDSGLEIPAGVNTIMIDREVDLKKEKPYNDCILKDEQESVSHLFRHFIQYNKTYRQKDCIDYCLNEHVGKKCDCQMTIDSFGKCVERNDLISSCCLDLYEKFVLNQETIPKECNISCPQECETLNFKIQQNSFKSSDSYLKSYTNYTNLKDDMVFISIFYGKLSYDQISQIPKMGFQDLVSSVGGTLSLFVGISFLTCVELIEILFEILIVYWDRFKKHKRIISLIVPDKPKSDLKIVVVDDPIKFDNIAIRF